MLNIAIDEAALVAFATVLLVVLAVKPASKALFSWLDAKIQAVRSALDIAKTAEHEASFLLKKAEQAEKDTALRIQEMHDLEQETMRDMIRDSKQELERLLKRRHAQLDHHILAYQEEILGKLEQLAVTASFRAFETLLKEHSTGHLSGGMLQQIADSSASILNLRKA